MRTWQKHIHDVVAYLWFYTRFFGSLMAEYECAATNMVITIFHSSEVHEVLQPTRWLAPHCWLPTQLTACVLTL
jgi:hypothetical protein